MTVGKVQKEIRVGMSGADVASALGSPNIVSTDEERREVWIYDKIATDRAYSSSSGGVNALILGFGGGAAGGVGVGGVSDEVSVAGVLVGSREFDPFRSERNRCLVTGAKPRGVDHVEKATRRVAVGCRDSPVSAGANVFCDRVAHDLGEQIGGSHCATIARRGGVPVRAHTLGSCRSRTLAPDG